MCQIGLHSFKAEAFQVSSGNDSWSQRGGRTIHEFIDQRGLASQNDGQKGQIVPIELAQGMQFGKNIKPKFLPVRAGDVFKTLADVTNLRKGLGFETKVDFEEGLKNTVDYWKNERNK